jgi:hypothetical protein
VPPLPLVVGPVTVGPVSVVPAAPACEEPLAVGVPGAGGAPVDGLLVEATPGLVEATPGLAIVVVAGGAVAVVAVVAGGALC